ncbi:transforming growth factor beta regulator 1, partial [Cladochytrium tenue]
MERLERQGSSSSNDDSSGNSSDSDTGSSGSNKGGGGGGGGGGSSSKPAKTSSRRQYGGVRRIQRYPVDDLGQPQLPFLVGVITVHSLGTVVHDRPAYHSERYIYPVGFRSSRAFLSMRDPNANANYICTVVDGGDAPKFVVTPEDWPDRAAVGNSATGAWAIVVK